MDVRSPEAYAVGHVPGASTCPMAEIVERNIAVFPASVFVVYCSGPHCNGADMAAVHLARFNRKVKKMQGHSEVEVGWVRVGIDGTGTTGL